MGFRKKLEPLQGFRLEASNILLVSAVFIHHAAGAGIRIHCMHVIKLHAESGSEVNAGVVHFSLLSSISALLQHSLCKLLVVESVENRAIILSVLEMRIAAHYPGHVLSQHQEVDSLASGKVLYLLLSKGNRYTLQKIPRL